MLVYVWCDMLGSKSMKNERTIKQWMVWWKEYGGSLLISYDFLLARLRVLHNRQFCVSCLPAGQYAVNHSSTAPHCIILQIKSGQIAQILQIAELSRLHGRPIKHRICDPPFFTSHTPGPLHQGTQKQTHTLNKWYWLNWVKELMADISKSKHPTSAKENHQTHVLPSISKELQVVDLCIKRAKPQKEEF